MSTLLLITCMLAPLKRTVLPEKAPLSTACLDGLRPLSVVAFAT